MKMEKEITVRVNCDYKTLDKQLKDQGFSIVEKYNLDDNYLVPESVDIEKEEVLNILKRCVLVRNIDNRIKKLTYKYKKYAENGNIIEQGKTNCTITDIDEAFEFMRAIGYRNLFEIHDTIIVYSNGNIELAVQLVNNKHIFIEVEDENQNTGKSYDNIDDMISDLKSINIDCDYSDFYVKKAEIVFNEIYRK